jgi:hypothetical protein
MKQNYLYILLFFTALGLSQERKVYVIKDSIVLATPAKNKKGFLDKLHPFRQLSLSTSLRLNPIYGKTNNSNNDAGAFFLPDGISLHAGMGYHINQTFALTASTGVDWNIGTKLFNVPVYASALFNISVADGQSMLLQYGAGYNVAIGQGNLSGVYQKFRVGYVFDILGIFAEINNYGYPFKDAPTMATLNLGVQVHIFR